LTPTRKKEKSIAWWPAR